MEYDPAEIEPITHLHTIPFIIWHNEEARPLLNHGLYLQTPVSAFYLGAVLLDYLNFVHLDPFFSFINELRKEYPILLEHQYFDRYRNIREYSEATNDLINLYRRWGHFNITVGR